MEEYRIVPWDHDESVPIGVDREFYIPPEIEQLAREVMTHYDMQVSEMTLITSKPDKGGAIWRIMTDQGPRSLKVLHREPRRSMFSVYAQQWLVEQGARVPALIKTRDGQLYVEAGQKLWIVTDWIQLVPASKVDIEGAEELVFGLGEFHRLTRGYVPPAFAQQASRIPHWPKYYAKMIEKIGWIRDLARAYPETAGSERLLSVVDQFEAQAREALGKFEQSSFRKMMAKGEPFWGLVHQDYGFSNGQMGEGGIWVIDLDGVAYDFPIRDLRKIITSMMDDLGTWDPAIMRRLIQAYHRANPIDRETYELLVIDMAFPNEFYKHIKEMIFEPELFMNTEMGPILDHVLASQDSKAAALAELESEAPNYALGDYEEVSVEERRAARMRERLLVGEPKPFEPFLLPSEGLEPILPGIPIVGADMREDGHAEAAGTLVDSPATTDASATDPVVLPGVLSDPITIPAPTATPSPSIVKPRRAAKRTNRSIRSIRRRKQRRIILRRKPKRPIRRTKAKSAIRSSAPRKVKANKKTVFKPSSVTKRKVGKKRVRRTASAKRA